MYIHQRSDWPKFYWNQEALANLLAEVRYRQGRLIGSMERLGFQLMAEAAFSALTEEILKSTEIEGLLLEPAQVRSSLARRLGIKMAGLRTADREVDGVVDMMLDATQNFSQLLTAERLFGWHAALFPSGWSGMSKIKVGAWREPNSDPMQVVSGPIGREKVHYEAPAGKRLDKEMKTFLKWFERELDIDPVLKSGVAHLWFVTIHPFDDGNGRIARAIADMALARSEQVAQRFYSMSAQIRQERNMYYKMLEQTQKGNMDITIWLEWFLACLGRALDGAEASLSLVLRKAKFWEMLATVTINERQRKVLNRLIDGFEGKLSSSKWAKLAKCSQDTALRDIAELIELGILVKDNARGRSTSYSLVM